MLSAFKLVADLGIISGVTSNVTKLFTAVGGNKYKAEKLGGIIFGLSCGCWAAGRFNNTVDAITDALKDLYNLSDDEMSEKVVQYKEYIVGKDGKKHYIHKEVEDE